ncbi:hypothetical protein L484_017983 [Morus notabilis]|uniref:Uncharacterized protein n=1 Tax=Morus notabilis TaxID=981085 RepID=W9RCL7_9ROSA|nr:hypothetical protein L484_017983 [Morus notabilis]
MQGRRIVVWWWWRGVFSGTPSGGSASWNKHQQLRLMVTTKASNRAAVHGTRLPIPDQVNKEEVEEEISKAKEEKERGGEDCGFRNQETR